MKLRLKLLQELRVVMARENLKQGDLASMLNTSSAYVSKMLKGSVSESRLESLINELGYEVRIEVVKKRH